MNKLVGLCLLMTHFLVAHQDDSARLSNMHGDDLFPLDVSRYLGQSLSEDSDDLFLFGLLFPSEKGDEESDLGVLDAEGMTVSVNNLFNNSFSGTTPINTNVRHLRSGKVVEIVPAETKAADEERDTDDEDDRKHKRRMMEVNSRLQRGNRVRSRRRSGVSSSESLVAKAPTHVTQQDIAPSPQIDPKSHAVQMFNLPMSPSSVLEENQRLKKANGELTNDNNLLLERVEILSQLVKKLVKENAELKGQISNK